MRPGKLRHRITLQQVTRTPDGIGGYTETWTDVATVWAAVEPLRGRELFDAEQVQSEITHRVRIRYRSGVDSSMRVRFGARLFRIQSVIDVDERHREIQLMCQEVGTDG